MSIENMTDNGNVGGDRFPGGVLALMGQGTWNSGTLKAQWSLDGTNWVDLSAMSMTADGVLVYADPLPAGCYVRANLAGASSPDLNVLFGRAAALTGNQLNQTARNLSS